MNYEERLRMLEVQTMSNNERMWELTRRIARIENVVTDHILVPARISAGTNFAVPSNPDELFQRMSTLAVELNGILPGLADAIRASENMGHVNILPPSRSSTKNNVSEQASNRNFECRINGGNENFGPPNGGSNLPYFEPKLNNQIGPSNFFTPSSHHAGVNLNVSRGSSVNTIDGGRVMMLVNDQPSLLANSRFSFSDGIHNPGPSGTAFSNHSDMAQTQHLDPQVISPPILVKDQNGHMKNGQDIPLRTNDLLTDLPPIEETFVYPQNPWNNNLDDIPWEATNNVSLDATIEHQLKEPGDFIYETMQSNAQIMTKAVGASSSYSATQLNESSAPKTILSYAGVTSKLPAVSSASSAAKPAMSLNADVFFNEYMKKDTAPKAARKEWMLRRLNHITESQKAGMLRAISRFALKQAAKCQLSGMGHLLDIMMGEKIVSQEKVLKCFCDGVVSDLPNIHNESQCLYAEVVSRVASILATAFHDTMKDLNWLVFLAKYLHSKQPLLSYGFCHTVLVVLLERKKHQGVLKLWHQTAPGKEILELPLAALSSN